MPLLSVALVLAATLVADRALGQNHIDEVVGYTNLMQSSTVAGGDVLTGVTRATATAPEGYPEMQYYCRARIRDIDGNPVTEYGYDSEVLSDGQSAQLVPDVSQFTAPTPPSPTYIYFVELKYIGLYGENVPLDNNAWYWYE